MADAEHKLHGSEEDSQRMLLVGYTATRYQLDGYPLANLLDHTGTTLAADVVATFLPGGVIDSLYAVMRQVGLDVQSLTLEPIAALNAAIPAQLRLLNLCLVDIGAGTSDIAVCRDGGVVGYTMATVAGDEITEALMRAYLVDFETAERIKTRLVRRRQSGIYRRTGSPPHPNCPGNCRRSLPRSGCLVQGDRPAGAGSQRYPALRALSGRRRQQTARIAGTGGPGSGDGSQTGGRGGKPLCQHCLFRHSGPK